MNTVMSYLRTAYRKLGATDRSEDLRRARELGIVTPCQPFFRIASLPRT